VDSNAILAPGGQLEFTIEKLGGVTKKGEEEKETAPFLVLVFTMASSSVQKPRKRATPAKKVKVHIDFDSIIH
jgi:hypothetical protein